MMGVFLGVGVASTKESAQHAYIGRRNVLCFLLMRINRPGLDVKYWEVVVKFSMTPQKCNSSTYSCSCKGECLSLALKEEYNGRPSKYIPSGIGCAAPVGLPLSHSLDSPPTIDYVEQQSLSAAARLMANARTQFGRFQVSPFGFERNNYKT